MIGAVFGITADGYNSGLNMTVGIGADGAIKGVIMGDNNETQGLGKKAVEPDFRDQFTGRPYDSPLKVVKTEPGGEIRHTGDNRRDGHVQGRDKRRQHRR